MTLNDPSNEFEGYVAESRAPGPGGKYSGGSKGYDVDYTSTEKLKTFDTSSRDGFVSEYSKGVPNSRSGKFSAGSSGNWSKELNNPLPNKTYDIDGNIYKTDLLGRTTLLDAPSLVLDKSARNNYQQRVAGRDNRLDSDVGGHLLGSQFGGAGEGINLVAMDKVLNSNDRVLGRFGQLENLWADNLRAGNSVGVRIQPVYKGDNLRPSYFNITHTINDVTKKLRLYNRPGG